MLMKRDSADHCYDLFLIVGLVHKHADVAR